jgi:ribonuclease P protein subunit POP4
MNHPEEFIGSEIQVTSARNKSLIGLKGKIVDETKKTFTITIKDGAAGKDKKILKEGCVFTINSKSIRGEDIAQRPEDRIKSKR